MTKETSIPFFYLIFILTLSTNPSHAEQTKYSVYCTNNKIEVNMRTIEQMKSARGSDVCQFGQFTSLSAAQSFARKQFGGSGQRCTCD
jgi:hypothetical protein